MPFSPEYLIVHCAATPPSADIGASDIDRWHRQRGWKKNGYHEVITRSGERQNAERGFKTRRLNEPGAHVGSCGRGWNSKALGICLVGGVNEDGQAENNFTEAQFAALREAISDYQGRFQIPDENVMGHRDLIHLTGKGKPKACPSFDVAAWWHGGEQPNAPTPEAPESLPAVHVVVHGDTLWEIAETYGLAVEKLRELNNIPESHGLIRIGQKLALR
jgi:hypothetical protein